MTRRDFLQLAAAASLDSRLGATAPFFRTVPASESGITWVHDNAASPAGYMPEVVGAGCAFFDYDNDGWMDIFLVNSGPCDFWKPSKPVHNALYRNNRDGTFTDVTREAGLLGANFGMGVAAGDFDGDGWPDLFITGYPHCILYKNNRNGTFTDITRKAGVMAPNWCTSAIWFDYDNDGRLDLYVNRFIDYGPTANEVCHKALGRYGYCFPRTYPGRPSYLFHNNGDGTFTEVGHLTDIGKTPGKSHGVVATDINNDGLMDLFVANDTMPNFLFVNRGKGRFQEIGLSAGVALNDDGNPRAGMGVDSADFDQDGHMDLFVANVDHERFSLYRNLGNEAFVDIASRTPIGAASQMMSGWGLKFFDYDNDGDLDLILGNGHPDPEIDKHSPGVHYREPLLLFHRTGSGYENVSSQAGEAFQKPWTARGLAIGDYDNDGALDVLVSNNGGAPLLLHNEVGKLNSWVGLKLVGMKCNIEAVGAIVRWSAGGKVRSRMKTAGGSFLSSHDPRIVLGLGGAAQPDWVEVKWPLPSGRVERFPELKPGAYTVIREGQGTPVS